MITPIVVSFWIFKTTSVLACPVKHRLSRAPPDSTRLRDPATPAPHSSPKVLKIPRRSRVYSCSSSGGNT